LGEKLITERELLRRLNLPACPYKSGRSTRISAWIRYGLNCSNKGENRFFDMNEVEKFLIERYKLTVAEFREYLRTKEDEPAVSVRYID